MVIVNIILDDEKLNYGQFQYVTSMLKINVKIATQTWLGFYVLVNTV